MSGRKVKRKCVAQTKANRSKHRCKKTVNAGTPSLSAHPGANTVSFQGRISASKKLSPGVYTLTITASNLAGLKSSAQTLSFTIVK